MKRLVAAASDTAGGGTAKVLYIASLVDAPIQTKTFDGSTVERSSVSVSANRSFAPGSCHSMFSFVYRSTSWT